MAKSISLFSGYDQRENRTTNYCLLVLKMLYEENPKFLSEVFSTLVGESLGSQVGVNFLQQQKSEGSIPDGVIFQSPFTLYIETKRFDWFHEKQLSKHLAGLNKETTGVKVLLALANFETDLPAWVNGVEDMCSRKYAGRIFFAAITFEEFLATVQALPLPKNLADVVSDFSDYLDQQNLLPRWQSMLDVVNCSRIPDDIQQGGVYMCPAEGGAYNHKRCRYFGMYKNKMVDAIAEIEAVVDVQSETEATVLWKHIAQADDKLRERARTKLSEWRPGRFPTRVFLLGSLYPTNFKKDTPGGMLGSKQYFRLAAGEPINAEQLAARLDGQQWSKTDVVTSGR